MGEIKITLESLYDILRNEKKREDLQKLEDTFFLDVVTYLREKQTLLASQKDTDQMFAAGEREKLQYELRSIKRILKELYEKREKKIIDIALNKSKTRSDIIDISAMLREENEFYEHLLANLDRYRHGILFNLYKGELPILGDIRLEVSKDVNRKTSIEPEQSISPESEKKTTVRFKHPTPSFVWRDMKEYGPFDAGEEIDIYPEVADLLVRKGRAEKV